MRLPLAWILLGIYVGAGIFLALQNGSSFPNDLSSLKDFLLEVAKQPVLSGIGMVKGNACG